MSSFEAQFGLLKQHHQYQSQYFQDQEHDQERDLDQTHNKTSFHHHSSNHKLQSNPNPNYHQDQIINSNHNNSNYPIEQHHKQQLALHRQMDQETRDRKRRHWRILISIGLLLPALAGLIGKYDKMTLANHGA